MLEIKNLENLKHIWNKDAIEALSFPNLETVNVSLCPNLKSIFPASVARGLSQLGLIRITDCGVEDIVSKEEAKELTAYFYFPLLTHIILWRLPHLQSFYPERHTAEFPKLKCLRVCGCDKMEMFSSESKNIQEQRFEDQTDESSRKQLLFSSEKIPDLEELPLKSNDVKILLDGHFPVELGNVKILHLQCFRDESTTFPLDLIERFHNLKELHIENSCFKEIFASYGFTESGNHGKNLEKIQLLRLDLLYNLKYIKLANVFNNLGELQVENCHSLINFAPPSASFQNLKVLYVRSCTALASLMTSSTAESLVQLTKMSVAYCTMLRDIITNEGDERKAQITFHKLESLTFDCLTSLTSFSSADCSLRFPSLVAVTLIRCPNMSVFSLGEMHAPKLRTIQTEGTDKIPWMGSLNATVQHLYEKQAGFMGLEHLDLSRFFQLEGKWPDQLPVRFFDKLKSLIVNAFAIRSSAIPANILPYLNYLEDLEVGYCSSIEEVFGIGQSNAAESSEHLSALCTLQLSILPNLKHLWRENGNKILDFRKLKQINIHNCDSLGYIFTPPILLGLSQLQEIEVKSCSAILEIVTKGAEQDAEKSIIFPKLNSITLEGLPNLKCFYSGSGIVVFPCLEMVSVADCQMAFTSSFLGVQQQSTSNEATEAKVVFPKLKKLRVGWNDFMDEIIRADFFCQLKDFELVHCPDDHAVFPYHILRRLPNLENLVLSDAALEEIAFCEGSDEDDHLGIGTQMKGLKLYKFPKLTMLSKDSQSRIILKNLESLRISECANLIVLVPFSVSFDCLTILEVSKCHGLTNLIISSIAKSLVQLTTLCVSECKIMTEVIAENNNIAGSDIIFRKLKCLRLQSMQTLTRFYFGKYALLFQNLEEVSLTECPKMEAFSEGDVMMPKLKILRLPEGEDEENSESGHCAHLKQLFIKMKQAVVKTKSPSLPRVRSLDFKMIHAEKVQEIAVSEEMVSVNTKNPNFSIDLTAQCENTNKVSIDEESINASIVEVEITGVVSDSSATSNNKKDSTEGVGITCNSTEDGVHFSSQNLNYDEAALKDNVLTDTSTPQNGASDVSRSHNIGVEQAIVSVTNTISSLQLMDVAASKLTSNAPSFQIAETPAQSATQFERPFANTDKLLTLTPPSSELATSSVTSAEFPESISSNLAHSYRDHISLLKKILTKPLSEVSRSQDVLLLSTLWTLKSCPHLNSQQAEIIQYYIEHFDTLVTCQPSYEDQIGRASAWQQSVQDDIKGIPELKTLYDNLAKKAVRLSADEEALEKKLQEVREEQKHVRANMEGLYGELVAKNVKLTALPKAAMLQEEAEDKARSANDHWKKISDLFAQKC